MPGVGDAAGAEGALDPAGSGIFVRSFALDSSAPAVPEDVLCVLPQFYEMVAEFSRRKSG
jgi:hypothetical protein